MSAVDCPIPERRVGPIPSRRAFVPAVPASTHSTATSLDWHGPAPLPLMFTQAREAGSGSDRTGRTFDEPLRIGSRSGSPGSSRWTFASAFRASVHCTSAALRHPGCACFHSSLEGSGEPSLAADIGCWTREAGSGSDRTGGPISFAQAFLGLRRTPGRRPRFRRWRR